MLPRTAQWIRPRTGTDTRGRVCRAMVTWCASSTPTTKTRPCQTRYAHLSSYCVKYGQRVKEGEIIGYSGVTGNVYGAHLHFEVILGGKRTNPLTWLDNDYTLATGREYQFNKGEHSVVVPEADKQTPSTDTTTNEAKTVQAILIGPLDAQTAAAFDDAAKTMQLGR